MNSFRSCLISFFLLLVAGNYTYAQPPVDSLLNIARAAKNDTARIIAYNSLARAYIYLFPDSGIIFAKRSLEIITRNIESNGGDLQMRVKMAAPGAVVNSPERFYLMKLPFVLNSLASLHGSKGEYPQGLMYGLQSLEVQEIIKVGLPAMDDHTSKKLLTLKGSTLGTLGNLYTAQAEYPKALDCFFKSLKIDEELGDDRQKAVHLSNMGIVYDEQREFEKALKCYNDALKLYRARGDSSGVETCYSNIGVVYDDMGDLDKALEYYLIAREIQLALGEERYSGTIGNIGNIYKNRGEPARAMEYYMQAMELDKKTGNQVMVAQHYANIGDACRMMKKYADAEEALMRSMSIAKQLGALDVISKAENFLSLLYAETGQWQKAYDHYKGFISARDSIFNEEKSRDIGRMEGRFESEKQLVMAEKEHEKQLAIEQEKQAQQRMISYTAAGGLCMVGVFAFIISNRLRLTRKQKKIIEEQKAKVDEQNRSLEEAKNIIEEKNRDIVDSITYARRLQEAIFPPHKMMQEMLSSSFIFYKPKDIVAGDFYWLEVKGDEVLFAVADCTGHGVPGAMVSVVCSNALNRAVKEFNISDPGKILDKVTDLVIETFEKSESEVKDGMDISLWSLNRKTLESKWAGANNSLWIARSSTGKEKEDMIQLHPDKQPVGKHETRVPFTTHHVQLYKGDTVYLFTDGFADQFGGVKGKKFKCAQLKQLLLSISNKAMDEQRAILQQAFEDWQGNLEQVDDVCIAGVRI